MSSWAGSGSSSKSSAASAISRRARLGMGRVKRPCARSWTAASTPRERLPSPGWKVAGQRRSDARSEPGGGDLTLISTGTFRVMGQRVDRKVLGQERIMKIMATQEAKKGTTPRPRPATPRPTPGCAC